MKTHGENVSHIFHRTGELANHQATENRRQNAT